MAGVALPSTADPAVNREWNRIEGRQLSNGRWICTANPTAYDATNDGGGPAFQASRHRVWIIRYDDSIPPQPLAYQEIETDYCSVSTLAVLPSGGVLLIYDTFDGAGTHALKFRQSWDGGITWNSATNLATGQWSASIPRAAVDAQGRVYIRVFLQNTAIDPIYRLIVGTLDSGGAWVWDYSGSVGLAETDFVLAAREGDLWGGVRTHSITSAGAYVRDTGWIGSGASAQFGTGDFWVPRGAYLHPTRYFPASPPNVLFGWWELDSTGTQFANAPSKHTLGQTDLPYDTTTYALSLTCCLRFGKEARAYFWYPEATTRDLVLKICDNLQPAADNDWR